MRELLPRDKYDIERANALVSYGYPAIRPVLPELMDWMQDMNWPVTYQVISPFLRSIGTPFIPEIRRVLAEENYDIKRSLLIDVVRESREVAQEMKEDLKKIASMQPENDEDEDLQEIAADILLDLEVL
ncbi:MAG: DUF5071 domain-containing protein [Armatimonadetes bacterium]|nr:DUF5071 domain-containing protein [Armatimonadota bacterium]